LQKIDVNEITAALKTCQKLHRTASALLSMQPEQFSSLKNELQENVEKLISLIATASNTNKGFVACANGLFDKACEYLASDHQNELLYNGLGPYFDQLLVAACLKQKFELALALLRKGAHIEKVKSFSQQLLDRALNESDAAMITTLIDAGASLSQKDCQNHTVLWRVMFKEFVPLALHIIQKSKEAGLDLNLRFDREETYLHLATKLQQKEVVEALIQAKLDPNAQNSDGNSPLHIACDEGSQEIATLHIAAKADIALLNQSRKSPFQVALQSQKWRTNPRRMREFFCFFFQKFNKICDQVRAGTPDTFCDYFRNYSYLFNDAAVLKKDYNPLEVAFLLQDPTLCRLIARRLKTETFHECVTKLQQAYPGSCVERFALFPYAINLIHVRESQSAIVLQEKPRDVPIGRLYDLYKKVNFTTPSKPDYIDPQSLAPSIGPVLNVNQLSTALGNFVRRIERREDFRRVPNEKGAKELFYQSLEYLLCHIMKKIDDMSEQAARKIIPGFICELVKISDMTAADYFSTLRMLYIRIVMGGGDDFQTSLWISLSLYRETLLQYLMTQVFEDVSSRNWNQFLCLSEELHLPLLQMLRGYQDPNGEPLSDEEKRALKKNFYQLYYPSRIVEEWLEPKLSQDSLFREQFFQFCKNNIPPDWGKDTFDPIKEAVSALSKNQTSAQQIAAYLQNLQIPMKAGTSPVAAIEASRRQNYIVTVIMNGDKIKRSALIDALVKCNVLTFCCDDTEKRPTNLIDNIFTGVAQKFDAFFQTEQKS